MRSISRYLSDGLTCTIFCTEIIKMKLNWWRIKKGKGSTLTLSAGAKLYDTTRGIKFARRPITLMTQDLSRPGYQTLSRLRTSNCFFWWKLMAICSVFRYNYSSRQTTNTWMTMGPRVSNGQDLNSLPRSSNHWQDQQALVAHYLIQRFSLPLILLQQWWKSLVKTLVFTIIHFALVM